MGANTGEQMPKPQNIYNFGFQSVSKTFPEDFYPVLGRDRALVCTGSRTCYCVLDENRISQNLQDSVFNFYEIDAHSRHARR